MKGILVHGTTEKGFIQILHNRALYDSSKIKELRNITKSEETVYRKNIDQKIFFQLVFETMKITGNSSYDKHIQQPVILFFDSSMIEEYGNKYYSKTQKEKEKLDRYILLSNKIKYLENKIPKKKVWFNPEWRNGVFEKIDKDKSYFSENYDPKISLNDNIENFYERQKELIFNNSSDEKIKKYTQKIENKEYKSEYEKQYYKDLIYPGIPKTFSTTKSQNEIVIQSRRISLKDSSKTKHLLAIYHYFPKKEFLELEKEYPQYTFLKSPEELQDFLKNYYKI